MGKLDCRVAIVTGAGRGIGREIARKLALEGARVVVNDLDPEPAEETAVLLRDLNAEALAVPGDVAAPDFGERIVRRALDGLGGLDIVVNNAGYIWNTTIQKASDEQWEAMLAVHATGPFRLLRAAGEHFRAAAQRETASGQRVVRKVVNVSSVSATHGAATQASYASAKAALLGLTRSLAQEWGRYRVTVNAVAFGAIETRLTQPWQEGKPLIAVHGRSLPVGLPKKSLDEIGRQTPLGRPGTPEEAAGAAYLLCIPESDFITGHTLICSGGMYI
jgi:3-oxoacyl-[acyl-carrier protein] reductase